MNRERDSEVVYELVTSKYKIAERNRLAKYRFLSNENVNSVASKHRGSEPSLAQTEKEEVRKVDLSVPGTPVSSRYLQSLGKFKRNNANIETDSEDEKDDDCATEQPEFSVLLQEGLKQFTSNMEKLQTESHDTKTGSIKHDEGNVNGQQKNVSKIDKYFEESASRGSLKRDFAEVVQVFDPRITRDYDDLHKPGTPISSKFIKAEKFSSKKLQPFTDNIKKIEAISTKNPPEKPKRINPVPLTNDTPDFFIVPPTPTIIPPTPVEKDVLIIVEKSLILDSNGSDQLDVPSLENGKANKESAKSENFSEPTIVAATVHEVLKSSKTSDQQLHRKLSVPGTPVDSRKLMDSSSSELDSELGSDIVVIESSEVAEMAKDLVDQIECLIESHPDNNITNADSNEAEEQQENKEDGDKVLIIYENNNKKVKSYLDKSDQDSSYQRTFSEIENFNQPSMDVKEKVEKYFKDSEEKKSFTRGFSEAVNYVEPVDIELLFKPGTPISSKVIENLKIIEGDIDEHKGTDPIALQGMEAFKKAHEALYPPPEFKVNKYFEESEARHTLKRDFSEVYGIVGESSHSTSENSEIMKFFKQSEAQNSFQRQFSEVFQTLPPRIKDILPDEKPPEHGRSSRFSVFSAPDTTDMNPNGQSIARKHGKKYGIDKYFAASLYRTAYHRAKDQRRGSEPDHRFAIVEDEYVFGESDVLRSQVFQDDDATPIRTVDNNGNEEGFDQQSVQFWRDFLRPYTLNLPSDIVVRDELIEKYTLE